MNIKDILNSKSHHYEYSKTLPEIKCKELERLAKIGKATEKALENKEYCIASYKGNHVRSFKTIDELLDWYDT